MGLPQAARRNADRARDLIREQGGNGAQPATPQAAAADVEALNAQLATLTAEKERLTQSNRVLQGKYDAEVPRLHESLRTLTEQVKQLEEAGKRKVEAGELTSLTDEERALAGEGLIKVQTKIAREVFDSVIGEHVKPLSDRLDVFQRQTDAGFNATLDAIPNYEVQNNDPKFFAWLKEVDMASGQIRNDLLQSAVAARQGLRCVEIFAAFREGREIGASATPPRSPDPGPGSGEPQPDLGAQNGTALYTRADIKAFYADKRNGLWRTREAEARALEADMLKASAEGRVRG